MVDHGLDNYPSPSSGSRSEEEPGCLWRAARSESSPQARGFGTKSHDAVNGLGLPVRLILSPGQDADLTHARKLVEGIPFEMEIATKGYDSQPLVDAIQKQGGSSVIPSRKS